MKKILALKSGISKLNNIAKFVKVALRTIEYFNDELQKEFPDETDVQHVETVKDGE